MGGSFTKTFLVGTEKNLFGMKLIFVTASIYWAASLYEADQRNTTAIPDREFNPLVGPRVIFLHGRFHDLRQTYLCRILLPCPQVSSPSHSAHPLPSNV